jgi:hypothetical protein
VLNAYIDLTKHCKNEKSVKCDGELEWITGKQSLVRFLVSTYGGYQICKVVFGFVGTHSKRINKGNPVLCAD